MKTPNLKFILETILEDNPKPMTREEKQAFMQEVKNFAALGESVYGNERLQEIVERVKTIVNNAERVMTESQDWASNQAHKKYFKRVTDDFRDFEASAREVNEAHQKMAMAYESIGQGLSRYFRVE